MEEQSHKSEMRAALQGDFERLRARRPTGASEAVGERPGSDLQATESPVTVPVATRFAWLDRLREASRGRGR